MIKPVTVNPGEATSLNFSLKPGKSENIGVIRFDDDDEMGSTKTDQPQFFLGNHLPKPDSETTNQFGEEDNGPLSTPNINVQLSTDSPHFFETTLASNINLNPENPPSISKPVPTLILEKPVPTDILTSIQLNTPESKTKEGSQNRPIIHSLEKDVTLAHGQGRPQLETPSGLPQKNRNEVLSQTLPIDSSKNEETSLADKRVNLPGTLQSGVGDASADKPFSISEKPVGISFKESLPGESFRDETKRNLAFGRPSNARGITFGSN